jgi:hypothetical protein
MPAYDLRDDNGYDPFVFAESPPGPVVDHYVGLDLGQVQDYSALVVVERTTPRPGTPASYAVRHMHRWPLGTPYTNIVNDLAGLVSAPGPRGYPTLAGAKVVVDGSGVGRAVVDLLRQAAELSGRIVPVIITSGNSVSCHDGYWHTAKLQLVSVLQCLMQSGRLKVARVLPEAANLIQELLNFKVKINLATGNESFEARRASDKDDLVLALACACWYAERHPVKVESGPMLLVPGHSRSLMMDVQDYAPGDEPWRSGERNQDWW